MLVHSSGLRVDFEHTPGDETAAQTARSRVTHAGTPPDESDEWRRTPATFDDWPQDWRRGRLRGAPDGGDVSSRRLLGAHLPAASPQRRETVAGQCLGCRTRFAIDVRLPLPVKCPDCGDDVLAHADIEAPGTQPRLPLGPPRIRGGKR